MVVSGLVCIEDHPCGDSRIGSETTSMGRNGKKKGKGRFGAKVCSVPEMHSFLITWFSCLMFACCCCCCVCVFVLFWILLNNRRTLASTSKNSLLQ